MLELNKNCTLKIDLKLSVLHGFEAKHCKYLTEQKIINVFDKNCSKLLHHIFQNTAMTLSKFLTLTYNNILRDFLVLQNEFCTMSIWAESHPVQSHAVWIDRRQIITC